MVSVCLPSDALLQHLPSYLGFSYLGVHISSRLLQQSAAAPPDLEHGIAPLGPPAPAQPPLLGRGVGPPGRRPWPWVWGRGLGPLSHPPWPWTQGSSFQPSPLTSDLRGSSQAFLHHHSLALSAAAPDLGHGVAPLGCAQVGFRSLYIPRNLSI